MKRHELLRLYFERKRKFSPGFSLRALGARLGISASFLSRVLSGKKAIPENLWPKLARALDVEPERWEEKCFATEPSKKNVKAVEDWRLASVEATQVLREWYFIPILELTTLANFDGKADSIAARLGLTQRVAETALQELVALGLLHYTKGSYAKTESKLRLVSSKSSPLFRKFHHDMLARAQSNLRNTKTEADFQRRLITGITVSATPEKIQAAKVRLSEFLHELANELADGPGTEVYQISAQLFPLTD